MAAARAGEAAAAVSPKVELPLATVWACSIMMILSGWVSDMWHDIPLWLLSAVDGALESPQCFRYSDKGDDLGELLLPSPMGHDSTRCQSGEAAT